MWLHESESNSLITEAYENKIFLTIIYISNNSRVLNVNVVEAFSVITNLRMNLFEALQHTHVFGDFAPGTATLTAALMLPLRRRAFKNSVQCNNVPLKIFCNSLYSGVKIQRTYFESHFHVLFLIILPDGQFTYSSEVF